MPRPLRIQFPGALYHITSRINAQPAIFRDDEDRERFLAVLEDVIRESPWKDLRGGIFLGRERFVKEIEDLSRQILSSIL